MTPQLRYILAILLLIPAAVHGSSSGPRDPELGYPFYIQHFSPLDYRAYPQTWGITQDYDGIMYVGNKDGVLVFDGVSWELVRIQARTTVRSLAVSPGNVVYVGSQGDIGFLKSDSSGILHYHSLAGLIPSKAREFWDVWGTHATKRHIFFQTNSKLFRWDGSEFFVWESSTGFHTSFKVGDQIYVREKGVGLLRVVGDRLELIPQGERFAETLIYTLGTYSEGRLFIGTRNEGLFLHDGTRLTRFRTEADSYLESHRLYHGITLPNDHVALGLIDGGGLVIIDRHGKIVEHLTEGSGLPDGWINYVFQDAQGGVWLALDSHGIVRADVLAQITKFGAESGLDGNIQSMARLGSKFYAATSSGLFLLQPRGRGVTKPRFVRINGLYEASCVVGAGDQVIVATHNGLFAVRGTKVNEIADGVYYTLAESAIPGRFYAGSKTGVSVIWRENDYWRIKEDIINVGDEVRSIVEDVHGDLWLTTQTNRLHRAVRFGESYKLEVYTASRHRIDGEALVTKFNGQAKLLAGDGLFVPAMKGSTPDLRFVEYDHFTSSESLLAISQPDEPSRWVLYSNRVELINCSETQCVKKLPEVLSYPRWERPATVHVDGSGVAWISSGSMIVRYDPSLEPIKSYSAVFPALVRRITTIDSDRRVFGRMFTGESDGVENDLTPSLAFENNALRFEFALPSYNDPAGNEFQYYLEGKEKTWSEWTKETSKSYTNLFEGTYRFHIRGRNAQGYISPETVYSFSIIPPWYRSIWAYGAYALALIALGLFARRYRSMVVENRRAKVQAKELVREKEVNERLNDLNNRLQQANETLRQADRMKDEFLANTSHELRTPLTGILGCAAILREEIESAQHEFLDMIEENGHRLLRTLDSLLDLARLRAGMLELDFARVNVANKTRAVALSYEPLAEKKAIEIEVNVEEDAHAELDDHCLECVLSHLIGNAVKFTDEGRVLVAVTVDARDVSIRVEDTGVGIDAEFLPFLFDEFKQESTGLTRSHEGNGLGLAVTARIVELMGGEIEVRSEKGVGSTFSVRLPARHQKDNASDWEDTSLSVRTAQGPDRAAA